MFIPPFSSLDPPNCSVDTLVCFLQITKRIFGARRILFQQESNLVSFLHLFISGSQDPH